MSDFASAAMVRLLLNGMRSLGLDTSAVQPQRPPADAHVPLDLKQHVVALAVGQAGLSCLLKLGRGARLSTDDPTHRAITSARDARDLFERWARLEGYVHSLHRVELVDVRADTAVLRHLSRVPGSTPGAAEDLVVLGVMLALLEAIGLQDVRAEIEGQPVYPEAAEPALRQLAEHARTATWHLRWQARGHAGHADSARRPKAEPACTPTDLCSSLPWPDIAHRCASVLLGDLLRRRTMRGIARDIGTSARSLQRSLSVAGITYSSVLAEARSRAAAWWLLESELPIAQVGFLAGYSDQPHFTRDFKRRIGLAPGRYRENFARGTTSAPAGPRHPGQLEAA